MDAEKITELLKIENFSEDYYELLKRSDMMSRKEFNNRAYIFAQIGINGGRCKGNCKFCSMADRYYSLESEFEKSEEEVVQIAKVLKEKKVDDIFLMTTAEYSFKKFLNMGEKVRDAVGNDIRLVANTCDLTQDMANELKNSGFTGAYHIKRLREGTDTEISPALRLKTVENIQKAGLELYYCIEPIGPEHTYEEIAEEIEFASTLNIGAMAVMRRTSVRGTKLFGLGQIPSAELLKICAVTRIATKPSRSMNVHETVESSLLCGVNQLYAELGSNPRDRSSETSSSRGLSIEKVKSLFDEYGLKYSK